MNWISCFRTIILTFLLALSCSNSGNSLRYVEGTGGAITNDGFFTTFPVRISLQESSSLNTSFGLKEVYIDLTHTDDSELVILLQSPDGSTVELSSVAGPGGQGYSGTCFASDADQPVKCAKPPFTGRFRPVDYIGSMNNGQNPNGTWKLLIKDWKPSVHKGKLNSWKLAFGPSAPAAITLEHSKLPIIVINSSGKQIVDSPRIIADMGIISNPGQNTIKDPFNAFNGKISVEIRGSSSQNYSKKSYALTTHDKLGKKVDVSLLGLPAERDWILYAPYPDKTLIRNYLTYSMYSDMGHYAPRGKFVELVINNEYKGVYMLTEKIKRDENRINISKLEPTDNADTSITGGYIFRIDRYKDTSEGWYSSIAASKPAKKKVFFKYFYPSDSAISQVQKKYLKSYVDSFEQALISGKNYSSFMNTECFVDFFLLNEFSKNVDSYKLSTYLYKDRNKKDSRIHIGPVWDFDLAWSNANYGEATNPANWKFQLTDSIFPIPQWWEKLYQDPVFRSIVKARWSQLRKTIFSTEALYARIDQIRVSMGDAIDRNFKKWPVLGAQTGINPEPLPETYDGEISRLKTWIKERGEWMDREIAGL